MRWLVVIGLAVVAVLVVSRQMNPISRAAAADTFGRRFMWLVHGWRVWRLLIAAALVGVAWVVATGRWSPATPAARVAGRPAASPAQPATHPAATSGGVPPLAVAAAVVFVAVLALALWIRRRRADHEMQLWLMQYDDTPPHDAGAQDPWEHPGQWPTGRDDTAEDYGYEQAREGDDVGWDDIGPGEGDGPGAGGPGGDEGPLGTGAGAVVHPFPGRRRRPDR